MKALGDPPRRDVTARSFGALAAVAVALLLGAPPALAQKIGVLSGLDKITARVTTIEVPVGATVAFGTLRITLNACNKRPPEETPETTAFLQIVEARPGEAQVRSLFTGWMFASSPALSALEHPVYDVWVIDCKTPAAESSAPPAEKSP